jgi:hypothetical protein
MINDSNIRSNELLNLKNLIRHLLAAQKSNGLGYLAHDFEQLDLVDL